MSVSQENTRITLTLPKEILSQIDAHIAKQYITRTKWFIEAAKDRIEKDNKIMLDKLIKGKQQ